MSWNKPKAQNASWIDYIARVTVLYKCLYAKQHGLFTQKVLSDAAAKLLVISIELLTDLRRSL